MYLSTFRSIYSNIADMNMEDENDEAVEYAEPLDGSLLDVSVNEEVKETFECDICGGHYSTKANLKRHLKKHEDPAFECKKCTQYFPSAAETKFLNGKISFIKRYLPHYNLCYMPLPLFQK